MIQLQACPVMGNHEDETQWRNEYTYQTWKAATEGIVHLINEDLIDYANDYYRITGEEEKPEETDENYTISEGWSTVDVLQQAKEDEVILTIEDAKAILDLVSGKYDANTGISWDVISTWIGLYLHDKGRAYYQYSTVEFDDEEYVCREIRDPDHPDITRTIAPTELEFLLKAHYGDGLKYCDLDNDITYYARPDELVLSDRELSELVFGK